MTNKRIEELYKYNRDALDYFTERENISNEFDHPLYFEHMARTYAKYFKELGIKFKVHIVKFKPEVRKLTFTIKAENDIFNFLNTSITYSFLSDNYCNNNELNYETIMELLTNNEFDEATLLRQDKIADDTYRYTHLIYLRKSLIFKVLYFIYFLKETSVDYIYSDIMNREFKKEFDEILEDIEDMYINKN